MLVIFLKNLHFQKLIYIFRVSQHFDLNNIKKFFHIDNENQFTTKCWEYEDKIILRTGTILAICKYKDIKN